jgi:ADP-heptose:LPS heptosyltransferase
MFHFLLIRFSSLGDVLLQTSMVSWLKDKYGDQVKITFVTSEEFKSLLCPHPWIERVVTFKRQSGLKGLLSLRRDILKIHRELKIDLVIDLHGSTRSWFLRTFLFLPSLKIEKQRWLRLLSVHAPFAKKFFLKKLNPLPQVLRLREQFYPFFHHPINQGVLSFVPEGKKIDEITDPYIVLSPVASFAPKRWPIEFFEQLIILFREDKDLEYLSVIIVGGPSDLYCQSLEKLASKRIFYSQGKYNLSETFSLIKDAVLCVGNDSGINHIAEASGVDVLTLFGPTHENFGFKPYRPTSYSLSIDVPCRPCSTTGAKPCHLSEQICFTKLTPDIVFNKIKSMLRVTS